MQEVLRALRPVKARIRRNRFLRGAAAGLAAGLAAAAVLQAAAFFTPVPDRGLWALAAAAAGTLAAALGNAARPVKNKTAAEEADACGLKERAVTALEPGNEPIRELQRKDACAALKKLDVKQIRPGSVKKELLAALGCAALLCGLLMIPNGQDAAAAAKKTLNRTVQEAREMIDRAAEEDEERLPDEKKSELRKITADLKRELGQSRDAADALVALDRAEQRLEQMRQQKTAGEVSAEAGADSDNGAGDGEQKNAEGKSSGGSDAKASAQALNAGDSGAGQMQTMQAVSALKSMVNPSLLAGTGIKENAGSPGQGMQSGEGAGGIANNSGQAGQNGAGGSGTGRNGMTGGGAGEGTTNEEQQGGAGSSGGPVTGNRDPRYKEVKYETIYDPEHIAKEKENVMTEQYRLGDEDSVQIETGPGRGNLDGDVPWGEALQEYADTEARAADRENLTVQERRWVDEYYRLLTEQQ
ncbi:MAG: hypothetical protein IKE15_09930 [Clostridia bacterium]|nr:hypothetical protein [Clostridia bacterium]